MDRTAFSGLVACVLVISMRTVSCGEAPQYMARVTPGSGDSAYRELVAKTLFVTPGNCGRVVFSDSSWNGEHAVSVYGPAGDASGSSVYRITVTSVHTSLYQSREKPDRISRNDVDIDREFALSVQHAFQAVLQKDPVPVAEEGAEPVVMDGWSAQFSVEMADGNVVAREINDPSRWPALDIYGLANDVARYCSFPDDRPKRRKDLIEQLNALAAKLGMSNQAMQPMTQSRPLNRPVGYRSMSRRARGLHSLAALRFHFR